MTRAKIKDDVEKVMKHELSYENEKMMFIQEPKSSSRLINVRTLYYIYVSR